MQLASHQKWSGWLNPNYGQISVQQSLLFEYGNLQTAPTLFKFLFAILWAYKQIS